MNGGVRFQFAAQVSSPPCAKALFSLPSQPGAELNPGALQIATRRNLPNGNLSRDVWSIENRYNLLPCLVKLQLIAISMWNKKEHTLYLLSFQA
jgi:hypothetical protein